MIGIIRKQKTKVAILFFLDILAISSAVLLSFAIRFEGGIPVQYFGGAIQGMIFFSLFFILPLFHLNKLYSLSWSYVGATEMVSLAKAVALGFALLSGAFFIFRDNSALEGFPRSTFFISFFLIMAFCGGMRVSKRLYREIFEARSGKGRDKTLIVGAGDAGDQILRGIINLKETSFFPIGFVDENENKQGAVVHGLRVFGKIKDISEIVLKHGIEAIIITLSSDDSGLIKRAVEESRKAGVKKIKIIPSLSEIIGGNIPAFSVRDVEVSDLLGRDSVSLDAAAIERFIKGKKVLITGGAGSIGSEICRQTLKFGPSLLVVLDQDETGIFNISGELKKAFSDLDFVSFVADIRDAEKMEKIFNEYKPEVVFHAAAYKHVPLMEAHPDEGVKNNVIGTRIIAELALKNNVEKFVFISTDKAINPTSVMGATKRVGEMLCGFLNGKNGTKFISLRFGNVLDSKGSVIPIFREQIRRGGPVEVTHPEMKRYFMILPEAVLLVMQAGAMGTGGEVFVLDMGKPVKIVDLAREMIRLSGFEPDKDIPVVFIGIRPGEKLFEEILTAEEGVLATRYQKIFRANLETVNEDEFKKKLSELEKIAMEGEKNNVINALKSVVPNYK